jgi:hypothetical protein
VNKSDVRSMRRLHDYFRFLVWQSGLGYAALWIVTFWTLDYGSAIFSQASGCHPDDAKVMFYWICDPASPLSFLAAIANTALTVTVWAPVYLAAATVRPDAVSIAGPILAAHVIGLPALIFITIRLMLQFFLLPRRLARRMQLIDSGAVAEPETADNTLSSMLEMRALQRSPSAVKPRDNFGLRKLSRG